MEFLTTTAQQLGLAVENMSLVEQVLRSHRQWTNTFDSIQDVVLLHDSEFRVMRANHALLERLGQVRRRRSRSNSAKTFCRTQRWANGKDVPIARPPKMDSTKDADPCFGGFSMVSTSSYVDQGSKQKGTIHVVRDITERRIAEEKYKLLFEQMQEGVFVATPEGKLLDCNDAFVRMLGYSSREELMAIKRGHRALRSPEQREAVPPRS